METDTNTPPKDATGIASNTSATNINRIAFVISLTPICRLDGRDERCATPLRNHPRLSGLIHVTSAVGN
jgi:hypothetical protein